MAVVPVASRELSRPKHSARRTEKPRRFWDLGALFLVYVARVFRESDWLAARALLLSGRFFANYLRITFGFSNYLRISGRFFAGQSHG